MTTYRTCIGCASDPATCLTLAAVRKQISGLGITSMKWRCRDRAPRFQPGDPVWATTVIAYGSETFESFPGVFIQTAGTRVLVKIEDGAPARRGDYSFAARERGYCKLPHSRIVAREGERVSVCRSCAEVGGLHAEYCSYEQGDAPF